VICSIATQSLKGGDKEGVPNSGSRQLARNDAEYVTNFWEEDTVIVCVTPEVCRIATTNPRANAAEEDRDRPAY
jgi:hypothetical protein